MSRGILDGKEVKEWYRYVCERFSIPFEINKLAEFTLNINSNIKPFHMEIKKGLDEADGTNFYCLVNLKESDTTHMSSQYSKSELELFGKVMAEIVCSGGEGSMSSTDALNLVETLENKKMSKRDAEILLKRLASERWLCCTGGRISLTPRTLMEFDHYIQDQYPEDCVKCNLCHKLVVKGQNCQQCEVRLHIHCAGKFFRPGCNECPSCKQEWPYEIVRSKKSLKDKTPPSSAKPSQSKRR